MTTRKFPELLTAAEVGAAFHVNPHTVARWAREGKLHYLRGPGYGSHRKYFRAEVEAIIAGTPLTSDQLDALMRGESL